MARNGTTFGIKLANDDAWYITDAPPVGDAMYYSGYGPPTPARRTSATVPSSS